jgi:hypothetical protein
MATLRLWPTDPDHHPDQAQEEEARSALQDALEDAGDLDADSYPAPAPIPGSAARARFVLRVEDAAGTVGPAVLAAVGEALGCPCAQGLSEE